MQKRIGQFKLFLALPIVGAALSLNASAQSVATTMTGGPGNYSRSTTVTAANGKTATYQNNAAWSNGSYTDSRTATGFNRKTATYQKNSTWGNGVYNSSRSATGFNGRTRTLVRTHYRR